MVSLSIQNSLRTHIVVQCKYWERGAVSLDNGTKVYSRGETGEHTKSSHETSMPIIKEKKKKKEKKIIKSFKQPTRFASSRNKFQRSEWNKLQ